MSPHLIAGILSLGLTALAQAQTSADVREVLELRDGSAMMGRVIAEKPATLYVDLGFDVIKVPRDQVVKRRPATEVATLTGTAGASDLDNSTFYSTEVPPPLPVKEMVKTMGTGVVSVETPSGQGSGFLVNADGYVVTNNHVIEGETRISVVLYESTNNGLNRRKIEDVEIVALNPFVDLALLKIPPQQDLKLVPVPLGNLDDLNAGDGVFAIGNPLGLERSVSQGIISTLARNFEGLVYLQTDAAINPGNSGGPLFNLRGQVVGVTNMGFRGTDNLGFAIPVNYVKDFLRNREAFAFDKDNPNTGYRYLDPPRRRRSEGPASASTTGVETARP